MESSNNDGICNENVFSVFFRKNVTKNVTNSNKFKKCKFAKFTKWIKDFY